MNLKIGILSLGCSKNLVDTENMLGLLKENGYSFTDSGDEADILIVNTCGFIASAQEESTEAILECAEYKKNGRLKLLIVTGCLAQRYRDDILKEIPEVDAVVGTGHYHEIVSVIDNAFSKRVSCCDAPEKSDLSLLPRVQSTPKWTAYLKIAEGCDNHCTYCVIPALRGPYRSRPMEVLLKEANELAEKGVKELIVIAQDTSCYGKDLYGEVRLPELLKALCEISGIEWIRVHYCYPEAITDELLEVLATEPKIAKYLDIPVQHSEDAVLKKMGRPTTRDAMLSLFDKMREKIPSLVLRTSIIVGFPGETEEEFAALCDFIEKVRFDHLGVFAYSKEDGTPAARLPEQIDEDVKEARREQLMLKQQQFVSERLDKMIGETYEVLVEGFDTETPYYYGRLKTQSPDVDGLVYFTSPEEVAYGSIVSVKIVEHEAYDLIGVISL